MDGAGSTAARRVISRQIWYFFAWLTDSQEKNGLFIFHDKPSTETGVECVALWTNAYKSQLTSSSIVAVHGLGGDAEETWADENREVWLRDFLPSQVPDARICSFGYDSIVAFSKSLASIDDYARNLLDRLDGERESVEVSEANSSLISAKLP
jgi:predicted alpha/beta-fold hydrolase